MLALSLTPLLMMFSGIFEFDKTVEEIEKCEEALKYLKKLEKDWKRTLGSF